MTLGEILRVAQSRLSEAGVPNAALDARLIVEHLSGTSRTDAVARPGQVIAQETFDSVVSALDRRIAGEPVHRILGHREFYGLKLHLSRETLEPRPDTETLVDALLPFVRAISASLGTCRILDLGTGTGAIALALISQVSAASATGADVSADALATARRNADALGLGSRFETVESDWFSKITGVYHAIAANPPYIPTQELETLQDEVRNFDPRRALDGGADGLDPYRTIASQAHDYLEPGGLIGLEIGHAQKNDVTEIFQRAGYRLIEAMTDLAGHDRALIFGGK